MGKIKFFFGGEDKFMVMKKIICRVVYKYIQFILFIKDLIQVLVRGFSVDG